ncbi:hypothetical protein [Sphingobium aquiterrae]|uniref:hypothetical protein n=1 Tax=Sphingobium aquiterrae TaxID=2038656 RepID=UPI003019C493
MAQRHSMDEEDRSGIDPDEELSAGGSSSGVILAIIVIAVLLAIAAMMMFPDRDRYHDNEAGTRAAQSMDRSATARDDAAARAGEKMRGGALRHEALRNGMGRNAG